MVRQHDDLGRLLLVIQIYVPVGLRVLVGADRTRGRWRRLVRRDYLARAGKKFIPLGRHFLSRC